MKDDLEIAVDVGDDIVVVEVRGEIDRANAHRLEQGLNDVTRENVPRVVDLTGVTFIDSTGLGVKLEKMCWGAWTPHKVHFYFCK